MLGAVFGSTTISISSITEGQAAAYASKSTSKSETNPLTDAVKDAVKKVNKKTITTETKKFAGQSITIQRSVMSSDSSTATASSAAAKNKASNIDKVCQ